MTQDLAAAEFPALMHAGRWKSARMSTRYIEHQAAQRGAVARFYGQLTPTTVKKTPAGEGIIHLGLSDARRGLGPPVSDTGPGKISTAPPGHKIRPRPPFAA